MKNIEGHEEWVPILRAPPYFGGPGRFSEKRFVYHLMAGLDGKQVAKEAMLHCTVSHEAYHRGQLTVYLHLLGIEPALTEQFRQLTTQRLNPYNKEADMNKINVGRVLLGGLVAGLVLNIGEYLLNGVILAKAMEEEFRRLNLSPPGNAFIIRAVVITFLLGIALVYLYTVIRPRFGAGVKTAICAGLIAWFFVYLYSGYIYESLGMVSASVYLIGLVWGLVEYAVGAIAGAWLYKEA